MRILPLAEAGHLPLWRQPVSLLFLMAVAMPLAFSTWSALLNNFVIERAGFTGVEIGWLHTVREIPGLLAVAVLAILLLFREQSVAGWMLMLLGVSTAVTAWFPTLGGIMMITFLSSVGFHYFETVNQSLQLQWIDKARAPKVLGWIVATGSAASLVAYAAIMLTWKALGLSYNSVYLASGGLCALIAVFCLIAYPRFEAPHPQRKSIVLRRRYWLYYALQFMAGARRQIFVVFAAFMMVEKFGFGVEKITALMLINFIANMALAPLIGRFIARFGEQKSMLVEYAGLFCVFILYGGLYWFDWGLWLAAVLYVVDHLFFAMSFAQKTYFQKIGDPADMAPTAAVAFTINHIAAVFLPALLGYLWVTSPGAVFGLAAGMAATSFILSLLVPRHPSPGNETRLGGGADWAQAAA
ncbi:MFS transporter [Gemmobacter caeni]|uniref:MFS transporter n=3 Tax=Paracoccaceae TaxID=31989 RepID=A0A2T6APS2_9RHOB|nr:MFS transporter [Gemmobacter caeni]TWI94112.1 MFS transporter [Gemmobacter caeni]GHC25955.1 MFS transporter [Gemmobacter nanjingensis]